MFPYETVSVNLNYEASSFEFVNQLLLNETSWRVYIESSNDRGD